MQRFAPLLIRIKALAKEKNTNIKNPEISVGLSNGTIRRWDDSPPSADKLMKIAFLLNTTVDYLMTREYIDIPLSLSKEDAKWLSIIHRLPEKKQIEFKSKLEGYLECYEGSRCGGSTIEENRNY